MNYGYVPKFVLQGAPTSILRHLLPAWWWRLLVRSVESVQSGTMESFGEGEKVRKPIIVALRGFRVSHVYCSR